MSVGDNAEENDNNEEDEVDVEEEEVNEGEEEGGDDVETEDELLRSLAEQMKQISDLNSITDSGNSSFVDSVLEGINSINSSANGFIPGVGKSRMRKSKAAALRSNNNSGRPSLTLVNGSRTPINSKSITTTTSNNNNTTTVLVNRRNRVSNVSNSSSESCATSSGVSGVSSSLSDEVEDDEDMINSNSSSSNSSLGSLGNNGGSNGDGGIGTISSSSSASCYYGTCGSLGGSSDKSSGLLGATSTEVTSSSGNSTINTSSSLTLERNDSGVGVEMMSTPKKVKHIQLQDNKQQQATVVCVDCDLESAEPVVGEDEKKKFINSSGSFLCLRCTKRRNERKEIICEIVDTELKYGRDLKIIQAEFARPIGVAGLLTAGQLEDIFLNLDELIEVNEHFAERLQDALEEAYEREDEVSDNFA